MYNGRVVRVLLPMLICLACSPRDGSPCYPSTMEESAQIGVFIRCYRFMPLTEETASWDVKETWIEHLCTIDGWSEEIGNGYGVRMRFGSNVPWSGIRSDSAGWYIKMEGESEVAGIVGGRVLWNYVDRDPQRDTLKCYVISSLADSTSPRDSFLLIKDQMCTDTVVN